MDVGTGPGGWTKLFWKHFANGGRCRRNYSLGIVHIFSVLKAGCCRTGLPLHTTSIYTISLVAELNDFSPFHYHESLVDSMLRIAALSLVET